MNGEKVGIKLHFGYFDGIKFIFFDTIIFHDAAIDSFFKQCITTAIDNNPRRTKTR